MIVKGSYCAEILYANSYLEFSLGFVLLQRYYYNPENVQTIEYIFLITHFHSRFLSAIISSNALTYIGLVPIMCFSTLAFSSWPTCNFIGKMLEPMLLTNSNLNNKMKQKVTISFRNIFTPHFLVHFLVELDGMALRAHAISVPSEKLTRTNYFQIKLNVI